MKPQHGKLSLMTCDPPKNRERLGGKDWGVKILGAGDFFPDIHQHFRLLGGGFKDGIFYFHSDLWGDDPI